MADNTTLNTGTGGDVIATDDIGGVKHQRVKIQYGTDGSATDVSDSNPLPIDDAGGSLTVDNGGTFAVQADSVTPGTSASNLGKAEDAAHSSGDVGVMALGVRNDTLAALAGTDGDYAPLQVNADGALYTDFPDFLVDTNNSTTSTLTANTDYTGTWTDLSEYAGITVSIFADQNSDANGMKFQFSSDGSNADIDVAGGFDYIASTGRQFQFPCFARYFRVVFQNAGTGQTAFRLQTLLHHHSIALTSIHRADADVAIDRSCELVKSILVAQAGGSGDFSPVNATAGGNLKVSVSEISDGLDIGAGNAGSETARVSISTDDVNLSSLSGTVGTENAATPTTAILMGGRYDTAGRTLGNGDIGAIALDVEGHVIISPHGESIALADGYSNTQTIVSDHAGNGQGSVSWGYSYNGSTWDRIRGDATNGLLVNLGSNNDITGTVTANLGATDNAVLDNIDANTSRGTSHYRNIDANAEAAIKGSGGTLHWIHAMNLTAAKAYLHLYDATTASVTPGTTTPDFTFPLPTQGDTNGAGFTLRLEHDFTNAITLVVTTTLDGSAGDPGTNGVVINAGYT